MNGATEKPIQGLGSFMKTLDGLEIPRLVKELESMSLWQKETLRSLLEFKVEMLSEATLQLLNTEMEACSKCQKDVHIKRIAEAILVHMYPNFTEPVQLIPSSAAAAIACTWRQIMEKRNSKSTSHSSTSSSLLPPVLPTNVRDNLPRLAKISPSRFRSCRDTFPSIQCGNASYLQGVSRALCWVPRPNSEPQSEKFPPIDPTWEEL
jgi:hypothetical protein